MRPFLYNYLSARFSTVIATDPIKKKLKEKVILRPLPVIKSKVPQFIIYGIIGVSLWTISITLSFNYQRLNSSTVQGSLFNVKHDSNSVELLGNNINFSSKYPWVSGSINNLKGIADIKYSIKGDKGD
ncbi:651_t:CDS:1 [Diversispora eburnea]|uniref:651_t:CDS:1 n=1 Tax=Diversispora eburnea TaxID=1213867 RepID=A0A9N8ZID3_9GLOM|nr:651_t:CDS:1 [Diversispora eburnea]